MSDGGGTVAPKAGRLPDNVVAQLNFTAKLYKRDLWLETYNGSDYELGEVIARVWATDKDGKVVRDEKYKFPSTYEHERMARALWNTSIAFDIPEGGKWGFTVEEVTGTLKVPKSGGGWNDHD